MRRAISPGIPTCGKWVWTTFNEHQWDLNWANPRVLLEIVEIMLFLANQGVEVVRLDAVAFMWKRMGTRCQNEPEVHQILQALRAASRIAGAGADPQGRGDRLAAGPDPLSRARAGTPAARAISPITIR